MEQDKRNNYNAIIPANVRYDKELKMAERLLYGEITALSRKKGYCFASNKYFAELYDVSVTTVSRWISNLVKQNYLKIELIKDKNYGSTKRKLYVIGNIYKQNNKTNKSYSSEYKKEQNFNIQKCKYHIIKNDNTYLQKRQEPIYRSDKYNNKSINNKIDRLFDFIMKKEQKIPQEFIGINSNKLYKLLEQYEMLYPKEILQNMQEQNVNKIKEITYAIALIIKNNLQHLTYKVNRDALVKIYSECKQKEHDLKGSNKEIKNFVNYFYRSIANEMTKETYLVNNRSLF